MDIEWFRDLVICVSGVVATVVFVIISILSYSFYKGIKRVLDSVEITSTAVNEIASDVRCVKDGIINVKEEMMSPIVRMIAIIQGVSQGIEVVNKFFKKEKGGRND